MKVDVHPADFADRDAARGAARIADVEIWIGHTLRVGVLLSAVLIAAGLALQLCTGTTGYPPGVFPHRLDQVVEGLTRLAPYAVIDLGLLLLIATPVFRVGASIIAFAAERDRVYALISGLVFCVLLVSFILGKVE